MCRDILLKTGNAFAKKNEFKINKGFWIKNKYKYFPVIYFIWNYDYTYRFWARLYLRETYLFLKIHIITIYIIILCIVIKWVCYSKRLGWRPVPFFKLIYAKVVKYLLNHIIIFYKCNNPRIPSAFWTICRVLQYGELPI